MIFWYDSIRRSRHFEKALVLCIVAFSGLIRLPSIAQPLGPDQGIMAVIGDGILHGKLPYRDFWEMASPAIFYTYAAIFKIFGRSMAAVAITDILISMLTTALVYLLGKSLWGRAPGYLAAVFFAIFSNGVRLGMHAGGDIAFGTFWFISQRETFLLPIITAAVLLVIGSEGDGKMRWRAILVGFLGGLAFLYKFPSLLLFGCIILYASWKKLRSPHGRKITDLLIGNGATLLGFMLAVAPPALYFRTHGALGQMLDIVFGFVYSVYGQARHDFLTTARLGLSRTLFIAEEQFVLWICAAMSSLYIVAKDRTNKNLLVVGLSIASLVFVVSHREFHGYHYLMTLPCFALLSGYGLWKMFGASGQWHESLSSKILCTTVAIAIAANLVFYSTFIHPYYTKFYFYRSGKMTQEDYYGLFTAYPKHMYSFAADYKVSGYIRKHTKPGSTIYALGGIESVIYFLTERDSPSRFVFSWILFAPPYGTVPRAEIYRTELLKDLQRRPPSALITVKSLDDFRQFKGLFDYLSAHYVLAESFPDDRYVYLYRECRPTAEFPREHGVMPLVGTD